MSDSTQARAFQRRRGLQQNLLAGFIKGISRAGLRPERGPGQHTSLALESKQWAEQMESFTVYSSSRLAEVNDVHILHNFKECAKLYSIKVRTKLDAVSHLCPSSAGLRPPSSPESKAIHVFMPSDFMFAPKLKTHYI